MVLRSVLTWISVSAALISLATTNVSAREGDYLMRIKCRAKCLSHLELNSDFCDYEKCLNELRGERKLGNCPRRPLIVHDTNETRSNYLMDSNCIDACGSWDYNCPEAERCCPNSCGSSCHRPVDLDRVWALPPVPCKLSVMESRRKIEICWDVYTEIKNKTLFFVIEGRSHLGAVFASHKLSDWTIFHAHPRYDHVFRLSESTREIARRWCFILKKIKPGRWYQFRVASVNEHGTRGFSKHSTEFQLKDARGHKYPKPPRDLTIGPVMTDRHNSSLLSATLSWTLLQRTQSIPVDKYKIFWSRHLPGVINSISMQQATVMEPQRHFELRQLVPDSTYYIKVQSISVFGQKRLRSKKTSVTLNTTGIAMVPAIPALSHLHVRHLSSKAATASPLVRLRFMLSKSNELVVKVHWQHPANYSHFQLELCQGSVHCLDKVNFGEYRAVNTTRSSFEFLDLGFDSVYSLRLKSYHGSLAEPKVAHRTFVTPECNEPIGNAGTDSSTEPVYCHVNKIVVQLLFFDFTSSLAHFKLILLGNQVVNITGNMMDDQKNQFKTASLRSPEELKSAFYAAVQEILIALPNERASSGKDLLISLLICVLAEKKFMLRQMVDTCSKKPSQDEVYSDVLENLPKILETNAATLKSVVKLNFAQLNSNLRFDALIANYGSNGSMNFKVTFTNPEISTNTTSILYDIKKYLLLNIESTKEFAKKTCHNLLGPIISDWQFHHCNLPSLVAESTSKEQATHYKIGLAVLKKNADPAMGISERDLLILVISCVLSERGVVAKKVQKLIQCDDIQSFSYNKYTCEAVARNISEVVQGKNMGSLTRLEMTHKGSNLSFDVLVASYGKNAYKVTFMQPQPATGTLSAIFDMKRFGGMEKDISQELSAYAKIISNNLLYPILTLWWQQKELYTRLPYLLGIPENCSRRISRFLNLSDRRKYRLTSRRLMTVDLR